MTFSNFILILILIYIFSPKSIMGVIKDFNDSPIYIKSIITSLIFLGLLFIFSLIYYNSFVLQYSWYLIVFYSLAISIGYYVVNIINVYLQVHIFSNGNIDNNDVWLISILQPVIEFGIILLICILFKFTFKSLIYISFILNLWRILFFATFLIIRKTP